MILEQRTYDRVADLVDAASARATWRKQPVVGLLHATLSQRDILSERDGIDDDSGD